MEKQGGSLYGYQFKWGSKSIPRKTTSEFLETYPGSELSTINPENIESFLAGLRLNSYFS